MMGFAELDTWLLHWITDHPIPGSIPLFQFISDATTPISIGVVLVLLLVAAYRRSKLLFTKAIAMAIVLIMVLLVSQGMKQLVDRERPYLTHPAIEKLSTGGNSSFPSGHTQEAFALAASLLLLFRRPPLTVLALIWAAGVGYSRVLLGVHYPSDVIAGALLGVLTGWVVVSLLYRISWFR